MTSRLPRCCGARGTCPRTLVDVLRRTRPRNPDAMALDSGNDTVTYAEFAEAAEAVAATWPDWASGRATRSGCGSRPARPTSTSRSWASCSRAPPTSRSTPTTPRSAPGWSSARPSRGAIVGTGLVIEPRREGEPRRRRTRPRRRRLGHLHLRLHRNARRASRSRHRNAAAFVDAEAGMFLQDAPLGPADRVMAGLCVAFDASCEEMWLAWRYGACLVPAPRALVRSGVDVGPWLTANEITVVSTVPTLVSLWPDEALDRRPAAHPRRRGAAARARRAAGPRRPRGLEHLRSDRGHRGRLRGAARPPRGRCGSGCRSPGGTWWSSTPTGEPVRRGGARRADHRRRRAGALPRPGQGRREVRADAHPRLGARLPQRRHRRERPGRAALRGPRRRPGQARRAPDRAGRDRLGAARAAGRHRRGCRRTSSATGQPAARRLPRRHRRVRRRRGDRPPARHHARRPRAAARGRRRHPDPDLRQGRPRRAAVAAADRRPGDRLGLHGTAAVGRRGVAEGRSAPRRTARTPTSSTSGGGSLDRRPGGDPAARPVSRPHRRRPLRAPHASERSPTTSTRRSRRRSPSSRDGAADPAEDPGRPGARGAAAADARRTALARPGCCSPPRSAHDVFGIGWPPVRPGGAGAAARGCSSARRADAARGRAARGSAARRRAGRLPAGRARCTCGSGRPSGSSTSSVRPAWPARRASPGTPGCSAPRSARDVDLHAMPPVTGILKLGKGASVEPEVDLTGYWIDGDTLHLGEIADRPARPGRAPARCCARGAAIGDDAEVAPGSAVFGRGAGGRVLVGRTRPAGSRSAARGPWSERPDAARRVVARLRRRRRGARRCCRGRDRRGDRRWCWSLAGAGERRVPTEPASPCCPGCCRARCSACSCSPR